MAYEVRVGSRCAKKVGEQRTPIPNSISADTYSMNVQTSLPPHYTLVSTNQSNTYMHAIAHSNT